MADTENWEGRLEQERKEKDRFFGEHPRSPIPADQREGFDGLRYYSPDPSYRFELELREHESKEQITTETTTEGEQEYLRWGEFTFEIDGEEYTLQAYKGSPDEERFWLPFRDETNGEETYGAGRYIDLEEDEHLTDEGMWEVDFNAAYNPFCVYSPEYECPLIPRENWLDTRIEAGEKNYESAAK